MSLKYNYEKTLGFIKGLERQISQLITLVKKISKNSISSEQDINKILASRNQIVQKTNDKELKKDLNSLNFLILERQQNQANDLWVNSHLKNWSELNLERIKLLLEYAKRVETKRLSKTLKEAQIQAFKVEITARTGEHKKAVKDLIQVISQWNIKNSCAMIQNLTTTMQNIKTNQNKRLNKSKGKNGN